jgi:sugar/nucleoside kinase (ribokinase family)
MKKGIIASGIWCVDISFKIKNWPSEGKTSIVERKIDGVGGGPSNVLTNLEYLGFKYPKIALGCIGKDKEADIIKKHNKKNNIISKYLTTLKKIKTSYTLIMSKGGGERTFFHYAGANDNLSYRNLKLSNIKNYKPKILYVGYLTFLGKLDELDNNNKTKLCSVLKKTKKMGMLNCLDLASYDHKNYKKIIKSAAKYCDYLFLNEIEAELATGFKIIFENKFNKKNAESAANYLLDCGVNKAVVLHSPQYTIWKDKNKLSHWYKSKLLKNSQIISKVGAGDAFCAACLYGIHEEWDVEKILKKAHSAASSILKTEFSSGNIPNINYL